MPVVKKEQPQPCTPCLGQAKAAGTCRPRVGKCLCAHCHPPTHRMRVLARRHELVYMGATVAFLSGSICYVTIQDCEHLQHTLFVQRLCEETI